MSEPKILDGEIVKTLREVLSKSLVENIVLAKVYPSHPCLDKVLEGVNNYSWYYSNYSKTFFCSDLGPYVEIPLNFLSKEIIAYLLKIAKKENLVGRVADFPIGSTILHNKRRVDIVEKRKDFTVVSPKYIDAEIANNLVTQLFTYPMVIYADNLKEGDLIKMTLENETLLCRKILLRRMEFVEALFYNKSNEEVFVKLSGKVMVYEG